MVDGDRLADVIRGCDGSSIAVSGGVDSMTLASFAQQVLGAARICMVHALSPAVPAEATERVRAQAAAESWRLDVVDAGEFADERYRANPVNRCYFCKSNLYMALGRLSGGMVLSGTNTDDLNDYRPGLQAATENNVRHPYVEAGLAKSQVRALARHLGLPELAELPASPCLSSRVETGIRIEPETLRRIDAVESWLRKTVNPDTVRCRVRRSGVVIELDAATLDGLGAAGRQALIADAGRRVGGCDVKLAPYEQGSAFVGGQRTQIA